MGFVRSYIVCLHASLAFSLRMDSSDKLHVDTAKVAVLEHTVQTSGYDAQKTIDLNLEVYEHYAQQAAERGAGLLVTPEYGITSYPGYNRNWWWSYGIDIPEAGSGDTNPCEDESTQVPVLRRLSCMAKRHKLALVASLIDMKNCQQMPSYAGCSSSRDGWLLLNTDVIFDADGSFLAKYHKSNKWGEAPVDAAAECKAVTFTPKALGIEFGVFTCADLIHSWPVLHLVNKGVRHFVMPLAWTNEMSQMQPLAWIQSWSRTMDVTLLSANVRTERTETGSGIFSRGQVIKKAYSLYGEPDELLVGDISRLPQRKDLPASCPRQPREGKVPQGTWTTSRLDMSAGAHTAKVCSAWESGAMKPVCCHLNYEATASGYGYVLAVLNGKDVAPGIQPWVGQVCAVVPCALTGEKRFDNGAGPYTREEFLEYYGEKDWQWWWDRATVDEASCLEYPVDLLTKEGAGAFGGFASLELQGNFSSASTVFPMLLAGEDRLVDPSAWAVTSSGNEHRVHFEGAEANELIQLQLYGRVYLKDEGYSTCDCDQAM